MEYFLLVIMAHYDVLIKKFLETGILIDPSHESEYCDKNQMQFLRLDNGSKIISAQRDVKDSNYASINFNIKAGAQYDPKGMEGAHHFLEHMIFSEELYELFNKNLVNTNAYTYTLSTKFIAAGTVNFKYKDWGLLAVLNTSMDHILNPRRINDEKFMEMEKNVIIEELKSLETDIGFQAENLYLRSVLDESNPLITNIIGSQESINNIKIETIKEILSSEYIPENISVSIFAEGHENEALELSNIIAEKVSKLHATGIKKESNFELTSRVKKVFNSSLEIKKHIPKVKNELIYVSISWLFDFEDYSKDYFAFSFLREHLNNIYFNEVRFNTGIAYDSSSYVTYLSPDKRIFHFVMVFSKEDYEAKWRQFQEIVQNVIKSAKSDKNKLREILEIESKRQKATLVNQNDRINFALENLNDFGYIGNSDVNRQHFLGVQMEDIERVLDMFDFDNAVRYLAGNIE